MAHHVTWYKDEATFLRFREICVDKSQFGDSYAEWVLVVQKKIDELARQGIVLTKAHIDPEAFLAWCTANAKVPDARARGEFGSLSESGNTRQ